MESAKFKRAAWNSLSIALVAELTSTIISTAVAIGMVRGVRFVGKSFSFALLLMPVMVLEIVIATASW